MAVERQQRRMAVTCETCHRFMSVHLSRLEAGRGRFCSNACAAPARDQSRKRAMFRGPVLPLPQRVELPRFRLDDANRPSVCTHCGAHLLDLSLDDILYCSLCTREIARVVR